MKKFKARKIKKKKTKIIKYIFVFVFFFSYIFVISYLKKHKTNKSYLSSKYNYTNINYINVINNKINNTLKNPENMLDKSIKYTFNNINITTNKNNKKTGLNYNNPEVYLYNTHQTEQYVDYNVFEATTYLKEELNNLGINTIKEEKNMSIFLDNNNLKYYNSYKASLSYMKDAIKNNNSLKYFFDIHRDSVSKDRVTITYNNKNYAKLLFIIGTENNNYKLNLVETKKLNDIANEIVPNISRGIYEKSGKGVNGVYNQDISKYVFLIEIGSNYSTKEEVNNTIQVLSNAIKKYIGEDYDQL